MGKKVQWSWSSAVIGAAAATAAAAVICCKPRDPAFHLTSIRLAAFQMKLPVVDTDLILSIHVSNPNVVPMDYAATAMSIFYDGALLGKARVDAGSQPSNSCKILRLPARLDGQQLAQRAGKFLGDVKRREMVLDAAVDIEGTAKVLWWGHKVKVHVDSHIIVDPVLLDVIDQENKAKLKIFSA